MRDKSPENLGCPCLAVCHQTAGLSCDCQYSVGFGSALLRLVSASLVSAPHHTCTSHMPQGSCSRTWQLAMGETPASTLCFCISLCWNGMTLMLQPKAKLLVVVVTPERLWRMPALEIANRVDILTEHITSVEDLVLWQLWLVNVLCLICL